MNPLPKYPKAFLKVVNLLEGNTDRLLLNATDRKILEGTQPDTRRNRLFFEDHPIFPVYERLSKPDWVAEIKRNQTFAKSAARLMEHFTFRMEKLQDSIQVLRVQSLVVRRLLQITLKYPNLNFWDDFPALKKLLTRPHVRLTANWSPVKEVKLKHRSEEIVLKFLEDAKRFLGNCPWNPPPKKSSTVVNERLMAQRLDRQSYLTFCPKTGTDQIQGRIPSEITIEENTYRGALGKNLALLHFSNSILSLDSTVLIAGTNVVRLLHGDDLKDRASNNERASLLVAGFSVHLGLRPEDSLDFAFSQRKDAPGWLTEEHLHLRLGSRHFPGSMEVFEPSEVCLPLPPPLQVLLRTLRQKVPKAKILADFFPSAALNEYYRTLKALGVVTGMARRELAGLEQYFFYVAGLRGCVNEIPVLGLITGTPPVGRRGPCAYIRRSEGDLNEILGRIWEEQLRMAGLFPNPASQPQERIMDNGIKYAGSSCLSPDGLFKELKGSIEAIQTHNEFWATTRGFFRAFGERPVNFHPLPSALLRNEPVSCIRQGEKIISGHVRPRLVCVPPSMQRLERLSQVTRPEIYEAGYDFENKTVTWEDLHVLEKRPLRSILEGVHGRYGSRRTFRMMLDRDLGEVPLDLQMGHGLSVLQPGGFHTLFSPEWFYGQLSAYIVAKTKEYDLDGMIDLLIAKVDQLKIRRLPIKVASRKQDQDVPREECLGFLTSDLSTHEPPPSEWETYCREADFFRKKLEELDLETIAKFSTTKKQLYLLFGLITEFKIPVRHFLTWHPYYTYHSFFKIAETGETWILAPIRQDDVGGMGFLPIRLGKGKVVEVICQLVLGLEKDFKSEAISRRKNEKTSKGRKADELVGARRCLFSGLEFHWRALGEYGRRMFRQGGRSRLTASESWWMLRRGSEYQAAMKHPGAVNGALLGRVLTPLNYCQVEDVLSLAEDSRVRISTLNDETFDWSVFEPPQNKLEREKLLYFWTHDKKGPDQFHEQHPHASHWNRDEIFDFFRRHMPYPSKTRMRNFLVKMGIQPDPKLASCMASRFMVRFRKERLLAPTKPFRLFTEKEALQISEQWKNLLIKPPENGEVLRKTLGLMDIRCVSHRKPGLATSLLREMGLMLQLLLASGARIGEICNLRGKNIHVSGNVIVIQIRKGKSPSARRAIDLYLHFDNPFMAPELIGFLTDCNQLRSKSIWPTLARKYPKASNLQGKRHRLPCVEKFLSRLTHIYRQTVCEVLKDETRCDHLSIHQLRHQNAFLTMAWGMHRHFWHGIFHSFLGTYSEQLGHSSFLVTIFSYLGTAIQALPQPLLALPTPSMGSGK